MFKDKGLEKSKENLSDNNKRFKRILETTQDGFFIFDKNKYILNIIWKKANPSKDGDVKTQI